MRPEDFERMSSKDRYIYMTMQEYPEKVFLQYTCKEPVLIIGVMAVIYNIGQRPEYQAGSK